MAITNADTVSLQLEPHDRMARDTVRTPLLTVIVPVYNEAATIDEVLTRVSATPFEKEVLVVDDGSTDATAETLADWSDVPHVRLFAHAENRGKGAAIRTALAEARGAYTIIQDGDLETDPGDYERLLAPLVAGHADAVFGSRFLEPRAARWSLFQVGIGVLNLAVRSLYGARLSDEACAYKVFPTETLRAMDLQCERFEFCPEVVAKACRMRLRIAHVPVRYHPRDRRAGKKIRYRDGWHALWTLWKWRHWTG
jgi:glycosyltransferase involved in cell wall biosynthesis